MAGFRPAGRLRRGPASRRVLARAGAVAAVAALGLLPGQAEGQLEFVPRNFSGEGNNIEFPAWGAAGSTQIRAIVGAEYGTDGFSPPGDDRPTAREVMTDVVLTSTASLMAKSALFVAWGQLVTFDLSLTRDNASEPFDVPCNAADDDGTTDIWCPLGEASDDISFFRSDAAVGADGVRNPINYATSYLDLDFVYGRSAEEAEALRTMENGLMNVTDTGVPFQNADGTWLIADQRTATFPVTFALHIILLLEHNRCCVEVAPDNDFVGDEDIFQACRGWTIAIFQHVTQNDFLIRLLGLNVENLGLTPYLSSDVSWTGSTTSASDEEEIRRMTRGRRSRRRLDTPGTDYNESVDASADVFVIAAGGAALESALPGTVRIVSEGYVSVDDDNIPLSTASADMAGLFSRNDPANILRGAILSPSLRVDPYYTPVLANLSPLFKLPVDAVQRGRDHGLPTYNAAREAFGLEPAATFADVTPDADLATRLSTTYGGDIDNLDAFTGALAEGTSASTGGVMGDLLVEAWADQLTRSIAGDRFYHFHTRTMEAVANTTLKEVIGRVMNTSDLPLSVFQAPSITVCDGGGCGTEDGVAFLSDGFELAWEEVGNGQLAITMRSKDLGDAGWMGVGWGGLTMAIAEDFVICEIIDATTAECTDRAYTISREVPPLDANGETFLNVTALSVDADWTSVTFLRDRAPFDGEDYDLGTDIDQALTTLVIYAYREGEGIGQHPNANRGAATINFATGQVETVCEDNEFITLHGALMLIAWMVLAPVGIYYARYRKGTRIKWAGFEWYEMHQEVMIVASEAVLPLGITAIFASGGDHTTRHAHWGYYMIAAVALQVLTGFMRTKGLEAKQANFSYLHRFNKHFHIWAGRFAYLAGVVQCYRGLELVSSQDNLVFSAGDGLDLELGSYEWIEKFAFPLWFAFGALLFLTLEARKQYRRYFRKGAASFCGFVELINEEYTPGAEGEDDADRTKHRLVPRTEPLPLYTMAEFNEKVLHGQSWLLVDGAILDVREFAHRHPGGARLILNALGTDVTHELLGEDLSVGHAMSFSPHTHPENAWEIVRSLVVGYIEEEEEEEPEEEGEGKDGEGDGAPALNPINKFRLAGKAVMMAKKPVGERGVSNFDLQGRARKTNELASLPDKVPPISAAAGASTFGLSQKGLPMSPGAIVAQFKRSSSSKKLLERFHVCPLLFREKLGAGSLGRGARSTKRPVYRYVFSCPGQAKALVEAIDGVCHFNMRGQDPGKGVIQRSYNAFAVRVQGLGDGGVAGGKAVTGTPRVIPAKETTEGVLCIEMRIRLYHDGAMSQLLDRLAKDTDNPAVQLQGPFIVNKLVPPPAHRNVILIAAGTGINPMMQQIRDYLALPRDASTSSRSRLSLVWQSTSEAELYGTEEITAMQAKSKGLLEVTVLVSGDQRRRNIPGAAFRKGKKFLASVSPVASSPSSSVVAMPPGRPPKPESFDLDVEDGVGDAVVTSGIAGNRATRKSKEKQQQTRQEQWEKLQASKFGPHPNRLPLGRMRENKSPTRKPRRAPAASPSDRSDVSDVGGGLIRGKVTREILDKAFGPTLLKILEDYGETQSSFRRGHSAHSMGESKGEEDTKEIDALAGTDEVGGKLQVVLSGPSGFVFYVETILAEMGVPPAAIVLLD
eukprot:g1633.t1